MRCRRGAEFFSASLQPTPEMEGAVALEDGVVGENGGESDFRRGQGCGSEKSGGDEVPVDHTVVPSLPPPPPVVVFWR